MQMIPSLIPNISWSLTRSPKQAICKCQKPNTYSWLTDGQITDNDTVSRLIKDNKKHGDRLFSLGLGDDADRVLIAKIADAGHGTYCMVADCDNLNNAVVKMLNDSMLEYYHSIQ